MLVVRSRNDVVYSNIPLGAVTFGSVDWRRYEPDFFDSWGWNHRRAIVTGTVGGIIGLAVLALGAVLK